MNEPQKPDFAYFGEIIISTFSKFDRSFYVKRE